MSKNDQFDDKAGTRLLMKKSTFEKGIHEYMNISSEFEYQTPLKDSVLSTMIYSENVVLLWCAYVSTICYKKPVFWVVSVMHEFSFNTKFLFTYCHDLSYKSRE